MFIDTNTSKAECRASTCGTWTKALPHAFAFKKVCHFGFFARATIFQSRFCSRIVCLFNLFVLCRYVLDAVGDKELAGFKGSWSSVHVFEVTPQKSGTNTHQYRLTSTVLVSMPATLKGLGEIDLSGSITKQATKVWPLFAAMCL